MLLTQARWLGCIALLLMVAAVPAGIEVRAAAAPLATSGAVPGASTPAYRLGTAGRPFAWSTVVGDFNADGRPDVIVADRASGWSRGGGFRLDFAVSGEAVASDTIQAADEGVGIRIADVDHDSDLDVVLASTISGRTLGVWLNDGAGHFTRSPMHVAASLQLTPEALAADRTGGAMLSADVPSRRADLFAPAMARAPAPGARPARLKAPDLPSLSLLGVAGAAPRAPPALLSVQPV